MFSGNQSGLFKHHRYTINSYKYTQALINENNSGDGCTQDRYNQLSRKAVGFLGRHHLATYAYGSIMETWAINNGKVTTDDRVGHYFCDNKEHYLQTPIKIRFLKNVD